MTKSQHRFSPHHSFIQARFHLEFLAQSRDAATKEAGKRALCYLWPFEARFDLIPVTSQSRSCTLARTLMGTSTVDFKLSSGIIDIVLRIDADTNARLVCVD